MEWITDATRIGVAKQLKSLTKKKVQMVLFDIFDLISFLIFIAGILFFIRLFVFNPYTVVWASMMPTFQERDLIIVDKVTPRFGEIKRWDILVFVPRDKKLPFIKRVVGLGGEVIKIDAGKVRICDDEKTETQDCDVLPEEYIDDDLFTKASSCSIDTFVVEPWAYLVFGDNRDHSTDSRCCFGLWCTDGANYLVYPEDLIGKVMMRVYPKLEWYW